MDLNHDLLSQSQVCCRYTSPVDGDPCGIWTRHYRIESAATYPVSLRDHASPNTWAGFYSCGDLYYSAILKYQNVIDLNTENGGEDNEIINGWQCRTTLPLVNCLRCGESENILEIIYRQTCVDSQACDVYSGRGHIDDRYSVHFIYSPIPAEWPVTQTINDTKRPPASYKTSGL